VARTVRVDPDAVVVRLTGWRTLAALKWEWTTRTRSRPRSARGARPRDSVETHRLGGDPEITRSDVIAASS
jgi:hypothetical protein